MVNFYDLI